MENEETEKQQLDEALKLVGDKLRKQSEEYTEFKKMKTEVERLKNDFNRLKTLMHQTIWFVDDMIKTHTNGCEHCLKKQGAMIALFKDIAIEPQWPIDPTDK
jgi:hypothetical protein